jgi:tRNA (Thr-GGU) A37 N-methylase
MSDAITTMAAYIGSAHAKYREAFGVEPHGTVKQMAALIELCPQLKEAIRLWDEQRTRMETD